MQGEGRRERLRWSERQMERERLRKRGIITSLKVRHEEREVGEREVHRETDGQSHRPTERDSDSCTERWRQGDTDKVGVRLKGRE